MGDEIVNVRKLRLSTTPDLATQLESLFDCVWTEERYQSEMARIEANVRVFESEERCKYES
jgi:hypothetical protein